MREVTAAGESSTTSVISRLGHRLREDLLSPPGNQYDALHGLRAVACFLVVGMHVAAFSGNLQLHPDGKVDLPLFYRVINAFWSGLDIFFVLSGFLIGRILMTSIASTGSLEFPRFFVRRALRVFPAYYFVLTLAVFWYTRLDIPAAKFMLVGPDWTAMRDVSWMNYVYVMNYAFQAGDANPMSWAWSLCVEEHFYLLLPALLAILYRSDRRGIRPLVLIVATLLPVLGRAVQYALDPTIYMQDGFYFRTHNRIDEILVGVVIAYFFVHHREAFRVAAERAGAWCWISGFVLIGSVWVFGGIQELGIFAVVFQFLFIALGTGALVINALFLDNRVTRVLAHRAWYPWARVSYGIYLTPPFVLFIVLLWRGAFPHPTQLDPARFVLLYTLTIVGAGIVAATMFVCLERPLIDWGTRVSRRLAKSNSASGA
jgi:peptidoglycan/LPS O-acetylase OafA/YrhL